MVQPYIIEVGCFSNSFSKNRRISLFFYISGIFDIHALEIAFAIVLDYTIVVGHLVDGLIVYKALVKVFYRIIENFVKICDLSQIFIKMHKGLNRELKESAYILPLLNPVSIIADSLKVVDHGLHKLPIFLYEFGPSFIAIKNGYHIVLYLLGYALNIDIRHAHLAVAELVELCIEHIKFFEVNRGSFLDNFIQRVNEVLSLLLVVQVREQLVHGLY